MTPLAVKQKQQEVISTLHIVEEKYDGLENAPEELVNETFVRDEMFELWTDCYSKEVEGNGVKRSEVVEIINSVMDGSTYQELADEYQIPLIHLQRLFYYFEFDLIEGNPTLAKVDKMITQGVANMINAGFSFKDIQDVWQISQHDLFRAERIAEQRGLIEY